MLTTLLLLSATLAADAGAATPWADPFDPASLPPERWAAYWPVHTAPPAPLKLTPPLKAKTIPADLSDTKSSPRFVLLTKADFLASAAELDETHAMAVALAADLVTAVATDAVITSRAGQRVVLSALLCEARALLISEDTHTTHAGRMWLIARQDRARLALDVLAIQPLACDAYPVERLVGCLGLLPGPECTTDADLAAQVRAAERLGTP